MSQWSLVERALRAHRFRFVNERELQDGIEIVLRGAGLGFTREASLGPAGTIDFLIDDLGVEVKVEEKPYAAYFATAYQGKYEGMMYGPQFPALDPYNFMAQYLPGEPKNQSHVKDGVLTDLLQNANRTMDDRKRRQIVHDFQRQAAKGVYYLRVNSQIYQAALDPALQNFGPNLGYDYGGRLVAAWWDR